MSESRGSKEIAGSPSTEASARCFFYWPRGHRTDYHPPLAPAHALDRSDICGHQGARPACLASCPALQWWHAQPYPPTIRSRPDLVAHYGKVWPALSPSAQPYDTDPWEWSCGFYPGSHPREISLAPPPAFLHRHMPRRVRHMKYGNLGYCLPFLAFKLRDCHLSNSFNPSGKCKCTAAEIHAPARKPLSVGRFLRKFRLYKNFDRG
jgi:hypothetical protein